MTELRAETRQSGQAYISHGVSRLRGFPQNNGLDVVGGSGLRDQLAAKGEFHTFRPGIPEEVWAVPH